MKLINIGFGNLVNSDKLIAVVAPDAAPVKRNRLYYSGNEPRGEHNRFKGSGRRNCP